MLISSRIRYNPRYIKPKYGIGMFSSFTRLVSNAASKLAHNKALKRGLYTAISIEKSGSQLATKGLKKAINTGAKVAKDSIKKGRLNKAFQIAVDSGAEIALNQLNRGVEATGNYVKEKLEKTLPTGAQHISNQTIGSAVAGAKQIGQKKRQKT